jgi:chorismate mutase
MAATILDDPQPEAHRVAGAAGAPAPTGAPETDAAATAHIAGLRARIDEIDSTLIRLWQERATISQQVGAVRLASGGTRLVLSREREILDRFRAALGADGTQLGLLILRAGRGPL